MTTARDATLRGLTGYNLTRAAAAMHVHVSAVLKDFGLRRVTFSVLSVIVENPGLRQGQLADALAVERSNIVKIVDELEGNGLVVRRPAANDRRAYALKITSVGRKVFDRALDALLSADADLTRGMTRAEADLVRQALRKMEENARTAGNAEAR